MRKSLFDLLKDNSREAASKVASNQAMRVIKTQILESLNKRKVNSKTITKVSNILDSKCGSAILSICTGFTFSYIPPFKNKKYAFILKKELQNGKESIIDICYESPIVRKVITKFSREIL